MAMTPEQRKAATKAKIKAQILKDNETKRNRRTSRESPSSKKRGPRKSMAYDPDKSPKFHADAPDRAAKIGPKDPTKRRLATHDICGAKRSRRSAIDPNDTGVCTLMAGWGTNHTGFGKCKWHGGNTPNGQKRASLEQVADEMAEFKAEQIHTYGDDIDIDPTTALAQEVRRTAGAVHWLGEKVRELNEYEIIKTTPQGQMANPWIKLYQEERDRLIMVSKVALGAGIAERQIKLAEDQGRLIATLIMAILLDKDLALTPEQKHASKAIVRKHIMTMDNVIDVPSREIPKAKAKKAADTEVLVPELVT